MIRSLPDSPGIGRGQAGRLDHLEHLALVLVAGLGHIGRQQAGAHELLGDGRCAALAGALARDVLGGRREHRGGVEAIVVPEGPVLGDGRRVEEQLRNVVEGHDAALLALEAGELDLAGTVVDDRRLGERQALERRGRQPRGERPDDPDTDKTGDAADRAGRHDEGEDADGEDASNRAALGFRVQRPPGREHRPRLSREAGPAVPGRQLARGTGHWLRPRSAIDAPCLDQRMEEPQMLDLAHGPTGPRRPQAVQQRHEIAGFALRPATCFQAPDKRSGGCGGCRWRDHGVRGSSDVPIPGVSGH